jgi:diguanylate cyclase (GGDEF)-like protein
MLLSRFKQLTQDIPTSLVDDDRVSNVSLYRFFENSWFDRGDNQVKDAELISSLDITRNSNQSWRKPKSATCFYHYELLALVIAIEFYSSPKAKTRKHYESAIDNCIKNSGHAFNASHDALTALKNKQEFDVELEKYLQNIQQGSEIDRGTIQKVDQTSLHLLLFDIDHFKQINDSNGHLYGNQVLRVLARRLENERKNILIKYAGIKLFELYRVGGEEFAVIIYGSITKNDAMGVANTLKDLIWKRALPSDEEWALLGNSNEVSGISLPMAKEREVAISLGVSSISVVSENEIQKIAVQLYGDADTALYCSKNGGRNRACHFDDILQQYGRVLQHHDDTNIITINIGRNVGVKSGMGFLVYHPDFAGDKSFIFSDGRTHKAIGKYPRVPSALITVFHVDKEISFCELSDKNKGIKITSGSWLEAIPTGIITPYIESISNPLTSGAITSLVPRLILENKLKTFDGWGDLFCGVFSIRNAVSVERDRGTAFVNRALARLYESIEREFDTTYDRAQVGIAQIAVIGNSSSEDLMGKLQRVVEFAEKATNNLAIYCCGVVAPNSFTAEDSDGDESKYSPQYGITYALYAVSDDLEGGKKIIPFNTEVLHQILYKYRRDGEYIKARKTYDETHLYGFNAATIENQIALCELLREERDFNFIEQHIKVACDLDKNDKAYRCNLALVSFLQKRYAEAYGLFKAGFDEKNKLGRSYWAAYALSCHYGAEDKLDFEARQKIFGHLKDISSDKWAFTDREELKQIATTYSVII